MVSYRVARTGKPHAIVEDLILPASAGMAGTMLLHIQASELYALQLNESTDVTGLAQLLVYVRYVYGGSSANHWKPGQQEYWTAL
jgi:hypothetical protein